MTGAGMPSTDISFFLQSLSRDRPGGVVLNTLRLSEELAQRSLNVEIVVAADHNEPLAPAPSGVTIINLKARRPRNSLFKLARHLRATNPRVLIAARPLANCIAIWAQKLARSETKIVVTEHSPLLCDISTSGQIGFKVMPYIVRCTYPRAGSIVAVSQGVADDLSHRMGFPRHNIDVIYNPVVGPESQRARSASPRHAWFEPGQPPVILGAGRLAPEKGFHVLVRAFSEVRKQIDARLMILGQGALRSDLIRLARELGVGDSVELPGHISDPYPFMKGASVFVLSSLYEGFGNVLVEAMACGTPVVSTDCPGGPREILDNGVWGKLVRVGDSESMAKAILETLQLERGPDVMARASRFTVRGAADEYLKIAASVRDG